MVQVSVPVTRLTILSCLLCGLAGQLAAQRFETINKKAGSGSVPTLAPNGDIYVTGDSGLFQLTPPAEAGQQWTALYLGIPGGFSEMVPVPGGNGFYVNGGQTDYGDIDLISAPSVPGGAWTQTILYTFTGAPDGNGPEGNLILNADGSLYGVTAEGGQYNYGTVYRSDSPRSAGRRVDGHHSL